MLTISEAIDLMDDARNNPPVNDETSGERAADTAPATPRAQLPTRDDIAARIRTIRYAESKGFAKAECQRCAQDILRDVDALYSRLAELGKVAAAANEAIRGLDTYADDLRADWSDFDGRANRRELHAIVAELRELLRASSEGARA